MDNSLLNPLKWNRRFLSLLIGLFAILWFGFVDTYSVYTRVQLATEISDMQEEVQEMETKALELEQKLTAIQNDPDILERIARENYYMRKKGETVYRIIPSN